MEYFLIFTLIPLAIFLAIFIPLRVRNARYEKFIRTHSKALKNLLIINKRYKFNKVIPPTFNYTYDNVNFYDSISCEDYLIYELSYLRKQVLEDINDVWDNKIKYEEYKKDIKSRCFLDTYDVDVTLPNRKLLRKIETKLFDRIIKKPAVTYLISVNLKRTKINGKYVESKSDIFHMNEIKQIISKINQKRGDFYLNQNIWDAICRVERGKVSNKMRFAIYNRDGYRCCMCHRKRDDLEIDHIIPIAKGGKSTYNNLQTLCHRCNKLKGDNIL